MPVSYKQGITLSYPLQNQLSNLFITCQGNATLLVSAFSPGQTLDKLLTLLFVISFSLILDTLPRHFQPTHSLCNA